MNDEKYELPISLGYVESWGTREAIREILQNSIDANEMGYYKEINYDENTETLTITNRGAKLPISSLVLGGSSKREMENQIGHEGEGYKLALVVLLRKGYNVIILNSDKEWVPSFEFSEKFNSKILTIHSKSIEDTNKVSFIIKGITPTVYNDLYKYFPCIDDDFGETVECSTGSILLDERFKGKMFVGGLYIQDDNNFSYGYNFNSDVVTLDRDRKAINYHDLRALTAESFVTAENCHPKLFKAISNSVLDVRDITDVIDEASDKFLEEYRDMFYNEKELDEDTLVATEAVKIQLEQMELDVNVVKGTEIESYLIAKANDKLGLIEEAKEMIDEKSKTEENIDNFKRSNYRRLMEWFVGVKKYLPKYKQTEFMEVADYVARTSWSTCEVRPYLPKDFDYSIESCDKLYDILGNEENEDEE